MPKYKEGMFIPRHEYEIKRVSIQVSEKDTAHVWTICPCGLILEKWEHLVNCSTYQRFLNGVVSLDNNETALTMFLVNAVPKYKSRNDLAKAILAFLGEKK